MNDLNKKNYEFQNKILHFYLFKVKKKLINKKLKGFTSACICIVCNICESMWEYTY